MKTFSCAAPRRPSASSASSATGGGELFSLLRRLAPSVGDPLPPERELADALAVSRKVLRDDLARLEADGVIRKAGRRARVMRVALADLLDERASNGSLPSPARASGLGGTAKPVGLVSDAGPQQPSHTQPGWAFVAHSGASFELARRGHDHLTLNLNRLIDSLASLSAEIGNPERAADEVAATVAASASALVVSSLGALPPPLMRAVLDAGLAVVTWHDPEAGDEAGRADRIVADQHAGAELLVDALVGCGCRQIVQMEPPDPTHGWWPHRRAGYESAMRRHNLPVRPAVAMGVPVRWHKPEHGDFELMSRQVAGHLVEQLTGEDRADALMMPSDAFVPGGGAGVPAVRPCGRPRRGPGRLRPLRRGPLEFRGGADAAAVHGRQAELRDRPRPDHVGRGPLVRSAGRWPGAPAVRAALN